MQSMEATLENNSLALRAINTIRFLSADAVQKATSGPPGTPMGLAPLSYLLWTKYLRYNPANPDWAGRDRFVLSCGHASMLLYSLSTCATIRVRRVVAQVLRPQQVRQRRQPH